MEKQEMKKLRYLLWHWGRSEKRIRELIEQMRFAKSCIDDLYVIGHSPNIDGMPRSTAMGDPVMREYERIQQARKNFEDEIDACEKELLETQRYEAAVDQAVNALPGLEQDIIRMRYKQGHTMVYIAVKCSITEKTAYNREARAITALADRIKKEAAPH